MDVLLLLKTEVWISYPQIVMSENNPSSKGNLFAKFILKKITVHRGPIIFNYLKNLVDPKKNVQKKDVGKKKDAGNKKLASKETLKVEKIYDRIFFLKNSEIKKFTETDENIFLIPMSFNHQNFDFAFWIGKEKMLYVFQITINVINHEKSDQKFFGENRADLPIDQNQIQYIWIGLNEDLKNHNSLMKTHISPKSGILNYQNIEFI